MDVDLNPLPGLLPLARQRQCVFLPLGHHTISLSVTRTVSSGILRSGHNALLLSPTQTLVRGRWIRTGDLCFLFGIMTAITVTEHVHGFLDANLAMDHCAALLPS
jgi:hypothetical protein